MEEEGGVQAGGGGGGGGGGGKLPHSLFRNDPTFVNQSTSQFFGTLKHQRGNNTPPKDFL